MSVLGMAHAHRSGPPLAGPGPSSLLCRTPIIAPRSRRSTLITRAGTVVRSGRATEGPSPAATAPPALSVAAGSRRSAWHPALFQGSVPGRESRGIYAGAETGRPGHRGGRSRRRWPDSDRQAARGEPTARQTPTHTVRQLRGRVVGSAGIYGFHGFNDNP